MCVCAMSMHVYYYVVLSPWLNYPRYECCGVFFSSRFYVCASGWAHASGNTCRSSNHINIILNCSRAVGNKGDFPICFSFLLFTSFSSSSFLPFLLFFAILLSLLVILIFIFPYHLVFFIYSSCHCVSIHMMWTSTYVYAHCLFFLCIAFISFTFFFCLSFIYAPTVCICSISLSYVIQFKLWTVWFFCFHFSILFLLIHLLPNTFSSFSRKLQR